MYQIKSDKIVMNSFASATQKRVDGQPFAATSPIRTMPQEFFIEKIGAVVKRVLEFLYFPWQKENAPEQPLVKILERPQISEQQVAEPKDLKDSLAITAPAKWLAACNVVHLGSLIAVICNVTTTVTIPFYLLSELGSKIASYQMIPKDSSFLRKALFISSIADIAAIVFDRPYLAFSIFQEALSCFSVTQHSLSEILKIVKTGQCQSNPNKAGSSIGIHLFNLMSGYISLGCKFAFLPMPSVFGRMGKGCKYIHSTWSPGRISETYECLMPVRR